MNKSNGLTSGRVLFKSTAWNLAGRCLPLVFALVSVPFLINALGTDRFGVLTLVWALIGYFSWFDLGLSRALTMLVAERLHSDKEKEIPSIIWTALSIMAVFSAIGMLALLLASHWIVYDIINVPEELQLETVRVFYLIALSVPLIIMGAGLVGIMSAIQRFDLINYVRIPMGVFMFLGPMLMLPFTHSLVPIVIVIVLSRPVTLIVNGYQCLRCLPSLKSGYDFRVSLIKPLLTIGSWMTVSNVISPILFTIDRFMIGAFISITAVAFYGTPNEMVTKLWLVPTAVVGVLFPAFTTSLMQSPRRAAMLFERGVKYIFLALFPITLVMILMAKEGLGIWLGGQFADNSTVVLQILAVGVLISSLSQVPFSFMQSAGRSSLVAKIQIIELAVYPAVMALMIMRFGIVGAAIVWTLRITIEALLLFGASKWIYDSGTILHGRLAVAVIGGVALSMFAMISMNLYEKAIYFVAIIITYVLTTWFFLLDPDERGIVQNRLKFAPGLK